MEDKELTGKPPRAPLNNSLGSLRDLDYENSSQE